MQRSLRPGAPGALVMLVAQLLTITPAWSAPVPAPAAAAPHAALLTEVRGMYDDGRFDDAVARIMPSLGRLSGSELTDGRLLAARCYIKKGSVPDLAHAKDLLRAILKDDPSWTLEASALPKDEYQIYQQVRAEVPRPKLVATKTEPPAPAVAKPAPALSKPAPAPVKIDKPPIAAPVTPPALPAIGPEQSPLVRARALYDDGRYDEAIARLAPSLNSLAGTDLRDARELMGRCYVKKGSDRDLTRAHELFAANLNDDPGWTLDPSKVPGDEYKVYQQSRADMLRQRAPLVADKAPASFWTSKPAYFLYAAVVGGGIAAAAGGGGGGGGGTHTVPFSFPGYPAHP